MGKADIDGLTAALQGQKDLARFEIADHGDGMGAFEVVHGQAEGLGEVMPPGQILFNLQGDDLRVRRHFRGDELPS